MNLVDPFQFRIFPECLILIFFWRGDNLKMTDFPPKQKNWLDKFTRSKKPFLCLSCLDITKAFMLFCTVFCSWLGLDPKR